MTVSNDSYHRFVCGFCNIQAKILARVEGSARLGHLRTVQQAVKTDRTAPHYIYDIYSNEGRAGWSDCLKAGFAKLALEIICG